MANEYQADHLAMCCEEALMIARPINVKVIALAKKFRLTGLLSASMHDAKETELDVLRREGFFEKTDQATQIEVLCGKVNILEPAMNMICLELAAKPEIEYDEESFTKSIVCFDCDQLCESGRGG